MGIKERRTKILLALFMLSDVDFNYVTLTQPKQAAFDLFFNQKTKGSLSSLIRENLIEKNKGDVNDFENEYDPDEGNKESSQYRLTEKGFHILCLEFPFFRFLRDKWDGKWRILSYEIPEKKRELRDRLRREVSGWGLGPWHRSFWVTPHPVIDNLKNLVSQKEEEQYIQAFESEHVFGDRDNLIEKVWQKSILDQKYRDLFKKWHTVLSSDGEKVEKFKRVISEYTTILREDPGLPSELVGEKWIGYEAFQLYKEIRSILLS
jgi:phenylacetic acid degradation operon negative regulatory protein